MNLRKAENYSIGLDLGTGSVGWAVVDDQGNPYYMRGIPTLGSRLFPNAETAAATRMKRGSRRRYDRRRQRIKCLQQIFMDEISRIDKDFFVRLNHSFLVKADKDKIDAFAEDNVHALFNGSDFTERDYYKRFSTIWHLRDYLMTSTQKEDIRLVYLALHNIVKYRGNFLHEDEPNLSAKNANAQESAEKLHESISLYFQALSEAGIAELSCAADAFEVKQALDGRGMARAERAEAIQDVLAISNAKMAKALARACVGYEVEFSDIFLELPKQDGTKLSFANDEKVEGFLALYDGEGLPVFEALQAAYSSYVLSDILRGEQSISAAMKKSYEQHQSDLSDVKGLIRDYCGIEVYRKIFRGPKRSNGSYDINKLPKGSYTAYVLGEGLANKKGCSQEELVKTLRGHLQDVPGIESDVRWARIESRLMADDGRFLAKQKTRANGAIPYQLHLEEMNAIIEAQGQFYPFLKEAKDLLEKVVSSRIPYYVGPLNAAPDPHGPFASNGVDVARKFAWSQRKPGMEHVKAYPWNVEEVIDTDETAERFIRRMTGTCTYLYGEPVLPRCSLLYEEFCVLNELNGARWSQDAGDSHRFDADDRCALMEELFKRRKGVSYAAVADWLKKNHGAQHVEVSGAQGEAGFESKLSSYRDFCDILGVPSLDDESCVLSLEDIEQIILWNTVFEDRSILKRKLVQEYGEILSAEQIRKIAKKRYTGWGRLSRKFLAEIRIDTPLNGRMGIIDIMREGDPVTGHRRQAMNLMEVLRDKDLGFQDLVDKVNEEHFAAQGSMLTVDDMQGSPALRRSVNQAMRIVEELIGVAGKAPKRICIEVTRDDDERKKGSRTKSRYQQLEAAYKTLKADAEYFDPEVAGELKRKKDQLDEEKLMLYFAQCGKSLYSGRALDINRLSEYQVDHIIPQAYIKDDSLDNKALVLQEENQRKLDSLLLDSAIVHSQYRRWRALCQAGLMSQKKFKNLTTTDVSERTLMGFINRQLVETSQIVKFVRQMCEQRYPDTEVVSVRASLSHEIRERCGLPKCRELNNYHHAHDAYLACQVARFMACRYPRWQDGFKLAIIKKHVKSIGAAGLRSGKNIGRSGFIAESFLKDGFDKETGEVFKDTWDASREIQNMKRVLSFKKVFITRMPIEQTGAFWDETIYSPHDASHKPDSLIPLKGFGTEWVRDTARYGGYNKATQAYFFAFVATDKKGRAKNFFEGVPVHLVSVIAKTPEALLEYAEEIAREAGCGDAKILRAKVPLRQKFILDGDEFFLCGRTGKCNEIRNAREVAAGPDETKLIKSVIDSESTVSEDDFALVFDEVAKSVALSNGTLAKALKLNDVRERIVALDFEGRSKVLGNIVKVANGSSKGCDMRLVGGPASAAFMHPNIASRLSDITWVDQSVTGVFERRTTYEGMLNGI